MRVKHLFPTFLLSFAAAMGLQAKAAPIIETSTIELAGDYTFDFIGSCTDCSGTASAHVSLHDYVLGTDIDKDNFTSFTYDGTNLFDGYVLTLADVGMNIPYIYVIYGLAGNLGGDPETQPNSFELVGTTKGNGVSFESHIGGDWRTGPCCSILDYGVNGTWTLAETSSAAPEPATWAMLLIGFGAVGCARRQLQNKAVKSRS